MNLFTKITAVFYSVIFALAGVSESVVGYTGGTPIKPEKREYCFDNDRLLIGGYYGGEGLGRLAKEAGIDFVIDGNSSERMLDEFYENGVGVIISGRNFSGHYGTTDDAGVADWINADVSAYRDHPALWGDDLIDEPSANCFSSLEKAYQSHKANHPDKFCLINLFPNYANDEQLGEVSKLNIFQKALLLLTDDYEDFCVQYKMHVSDYLNTISTDYLCVDFYPYHSELDKNGSEVKSTNSTWLRNLDTLAEACRETGRDLWVITQAAGETKDGTIAEGKGSMRWCDEVTDISQQAYASLSFGAKAIIHGLFANKGWWDVDSHMIGSSGQPTETYYAVKTVDEYLKAFASEYGKYQYKSTYMLNRKKVAGFNKGRLAVTVESEKTNITSKNGLVIGTFADKAGNKAYIITNMEELNNNVTANAVFKVPEGKTAKVWQKGEASEYRSGTEINLVLGAGEGVFVTVK